MAQFDAERRDGSTIFAVAHSPLVRRAVLGVDHRENYTSRWTAELG
jgi:hypothetical protein